jgi:hypothetical protein
VVVDAERRRKQNKITLGSEWRTVLKKSLPESALLEMSANASIRGSRAPDAQL